MSGAAPADMTNPCHLETIDERCGDGDRVSAGLRTHDDLRGSGRSRHSEAGATNGGFVDDEDGSSASSAADNPVSSSSESASPGTSPNQESSPVSHNRAPTMYRQFTHTSRGTFSFHLVELQESETLV